MRKFCLLSVSPTAMHEAAFTLVLTLRPAFVEILHRCRVITHCLFCVQRALYGKTGIPLNCCSTGSCAFSIWLKRDPLLRKRYIACPSSTRFCIVASQTYSCSLLNYHCLNSSETPLPVIFCAACCLGV